MQNERNIRKRVHFCFNGNNARLPLDGRRGFGQAFLFFFFGGGGRVFFLGGRAEIVTSSIFLVPQKKGTLGASGICTDLPVAIPIENGIGLESWKSGYEVIEKTALYTDREGC